jgi:hypothetical protein
VSILRRTRLSCSRVYSRGGEAVASASGPAAGRGFGGVSGFRSGEGAFSRSTVGGSASPSFVECAMSNKTQTSAESDHGISRTSKNANMSYHKQERSAILTITTLRSDSNGAIAYLRPSTVHQL